MQPAKSFEDFEVWKSGREITGQVYSLARRKAFAADYALKGQICRASISIMSNIAEGYESHTRNTFIRYLGIAKGSCGEVRSQLYVAFDQNYISEKEFKALAELCRRTSRQISALILYLKSSACPCNLQPATCNL
jgi:four helix bundle protein